MSKKVEILTDEALLKLFDVHHELGLLCLLGVLDLVDLGFQSTLLLLSVLVFLT